MADCEGALLIPIPVPGQPHFPDTSLSQTDTCIIGRQEGVQLSISEASISRQHAEISYAGNCYVLRDLSSTNGTFVNDLRVSPVYPRILQADDILRFGDLVTFKFVIHPLEKTIEVSA